MREATSNKITREQKWRHFAGLSLTLLLILILSFLANASPRNQGRQKQLTDEEISAAERRLAELGYLTGPVDGKFDGATQHALIAFQKIEGRKRSGKLTYGELEALQAASTPSAREAGYPHVEIDLKRQVLMVVDAGGKVTHIIPVSTGNGQLYVDHGQSHRAHTPRGRFTVQRKISGWRRSSLGLLYYPNYIVNGIAIHGSASVPPFPASHGCIRIPMSVAKQVSELTPVATMVFIYDS